MDERFIIVLPEHVLGFGGTIAVSNRNGSRQLRLTAQLHIVIAGDLVADDALLGLTGIGRGLGIDGNGTGGETVGLGSHGEGALILGGLNHRHQLAGTDIASQALVGGVVGLAAVVHADDLAVALDGEGDGHVVGIDQIAVGILHIDGDVAQIIAVGSDGAAVSGERELVGLVGGLDHAAAFGLFDHIALSVVSHGLQRSLSIRHPEGGVQAFIFGLLTERVFGPSKAVRGSPGTVSISGLCGSDHRFGSADQRIIQIQLDLGGVGVNHHFHIMVGTEDHVFLVPGGQHMQGGHVLIPLALIEPVSILRQTIGVNDTKVRGLRSGPGGRIVGLTGTGAIPGGRLADIVKAGPDELAHAPIQL